MQHSARASDEIILVHNSDSKDEEISLNSNLDPFQSQEQNENDYMKKHSPSREAQETEEVTMSSKNSTFVPQEASNSQESAENASEKNSIKLANEKTCAQKFFVAKLEDLKELEETKSKSTSEPRREQKRRRKHKKVAAKLIFRDSDDVSFPFTSL